MSVRVRKPGELPFSPPRGRLIEKFQIKFPDGRTLDARLHVGDSTPPVRSRRIVVYDQAGTRVYDTDDCYDLGNATNELDLWIAEQVRLAAAQAQLTAQAIAEKSESSSVVTPAQALVA